MCKISFLDKLSFLLVLIGAINWGFIGLLSINIVSFFTGGSVILLRLIYIIIFTAAIDLIYLVYKCNPFKFNY